MHVTMYFIQFQILMNKYSCGVDEQTSYLSQISQIISVEKNLSCGEISDFCKEFEQFIEFYRNLCRFCSKSV